MEPVDPSSLSYQAPTIRRLILLSYWVIILLGIPLWWHLTSITRLALPEIPSQKRVELPIKLRLDTSDDVLSKVRTGLKGISNVDVQPLLSNVDNTEDLFHVYTRSSSPEISVGDAHLELSLAHHSVDTLVSTLRALLSPPQSTNKAVVYSPRCRLSFSLLNEDASHGSYIDDWDVRTAINTHIAPLLDTLGVLHNFTLESQVQFVAPLAFDPLSLGQDGYGLTQEHLTVFVNSAEWTLSSSITNDPVLHLLIYVPSSPKRPLHLLGDDGSISSSNALLLPQWGSIVVFNPQGSQTRPLTAQSLTPIFRLFAHHLSLLLGVPPLPPSVQNHRNKAITKWQLDALLRSRVYENTKEAHSTLASITKLVSRIENMPVESAVLEDVQNALASLKVLFSSSSLNPTEALTESARALTHSSRAFFNPGMLAMLYFPAEHKYAVYTPLFASAIIPLVAAVFREVKASRKEKREREQRQAANE